MIKQTAEMKDISDKNGFYSSLIICYNYYLYTVNLFTEVYINNFTIIQSKINYPKKSLSLHLLSIAPLLNYLYLQKEKKKEVKCSQNN